MGSTIRKLDRETVYPTGEVDHGASALENLNEIGHALKFMGTGVPRALVGRGAIDREAKVTNAAMYGINLAVGVGMTAIAPVLIVKDAVDAAVHGILSLFKGKK